MEFQFKSSYTGLLTAVKILIFSTLTHGGLWAQAPKKPTSGEIYHMMEKLGFLGSVLYVAAHPDDENTRLISFLANEKKAHTTYLSLTRGDGGQNLIGPEISELLGVIRTEELLMARSVDNGRQMFTRAIDFGYSKNAEETISIWDTEQVKADVVWAIRRTRPDVIINRFSHKTSGETHGHHTASAMLSFDLFEKTGDKNVHPEQLKYVQPWSPQRLFFNTSWWFYGSEEKFKKADKSALMSLDVGTYFPLLGKSNTEIAAESRSKHKCQGFGSTGTRGLQLEYLELLKGDMPASKSDIFEGINTTWSRVKGGHKVQPLVDELLKGYDFRNPHLSVPRLIKIYNKIRETKDAFWRDMKMKETEDLIVACSGLYLEARTNIHKATPGETVNLDLEATSRLPVPIILNAVKGKGIQMDTFLALSLLPNEPFKYSRQVTIPLSAAYTAPYWLTTRGSKGLYHVHDQQIIGNPETKRELAVLFSLEIGGEKFEFERQIVYKFNSPEMGESYRPFEIVPHLTVKIKDPVYIFSSTEARSIDLKVTSWAANQKGTISLPVPAGWKVSPETHAVNLNAKGESADFSFMVTPPDNAAEIVIHPVIKSGDQTFDMEMIDIGYEHIPYQTVLQKAECKLSKLNIRTAGNRIAYIMGAGDEVPACLSQAGYRVDIVKSQDLSSQNLKTYNALVVGVRAYNTDENLKFKQKEIFEFIRSGGNVIVQYNTSNGLVTKELAPFNLSLSRNRVSVEEAEMRILVPDHPVFNYPNKIGPEDFAGWTQERGLYFAGEWDPAFLPLLSSNDPGESPQDGGLLVAKYGQGHYVYTGLSFFRQLPQGVPGAFRLFANLLSLGNDVKP